MADCISRAALLAAYDAAHVGPPGGARKLIEEAPAVAVPEWISVQEKLPENNDKVLAFTLSGKYAVARYDQRRRCWIAAGNLTVTHWMPLPDVPEVEA